MSDRYDPVRAWLEFDDITRYQETAVEGQWFGCDIPKNGEAAYVEYDGYFDGVIAAVGKRKAPLRSLRVLLRSGHEITMDPSSQVGREAGVWWLRVGTREFGVNRHIKANTDAEAVSRALSEARTWLEEQGVTG